jgi:uncharacterized protein YceK
MMKPFLINIIAVFLLAGCGGVDTPHKQPGQAVVCHRGTTASVSSRDYIRHIEHGDIAGPCAN